MNQKSKKQQANQVNQTKENKMHALNITAEALEPIKRLSKDIKLATAEMSDKEARFLVDTYYQMQGNRIVSDNQIRSMRETGEPNLVLQWLSAQNSVLENQIKSALGRYVDSHIMGDWMKSIMGIGDVISAGLLAYIDITKAKTAGAIWDYAGLNPDNSINMIAYYSKFLTHKLLQQSNQPTALGALTND